MVKEMIPMTNLEDVAVDIRTLSSNFADVVPDCTGLGVDPKTEVENRYPLYFWLLRTQLARRVRAMINNTDHGMCILHKDATSGKYVIEIPQTFWSLPAQDTSAECCWQPFDFAKCGANVPINRVCLKDCDNIDDIFMDKIRKMNATYGDIARKGESVRAVKDRIARLSLAFLTANNVILGTDNNTTDTLKPFHGLLQVMSNPAIVRIAGTDVLSAFDTLWCRLTILGYTDVVFAVHPMIYNSILSVIRTGQNGELPLGWTRNGDVIKFHGMGFIQDKTVPVDLTSATGTIWVLSGDAIGSWMYADLGGVKRPTYEGGQFEERPLVDGCGQECQWWYNYGTVFNNNANKLAIIEQVPISSYCVSATGDLGALIQPNTLIPKI